MTNANILQKVEIAFWDRAIPLMSESQTVRRWIREVYEIHTQPSRAIWIPVTMVASACLGLGLGYLIGIINLLIS